MAAIPDSQLRLREIRALWDKILEVEREMEDLKAGLKEKKEARESLLLQVKEAIYNPQATLDFEGDE
jgi:hypothetical protein